MSTKPEVIIFNPNTPDSIALRCSLGITIALYRKHHHMSQIQLAKRLGIDKSTVSKIENGRFAMSLDYLEKFALVLGFKVEVSPAKSVPSSEHKISFKL